MARTYPIERPATVRAFPFRAVPVHAGAAVAAGVVVLLAVLRFGGAVRPEIPGLPTAGPVTAWGLPLARFCYDLCAVGCVGTLTAALLAPAASPESAACRRAAGRWALGWALFTALSYVLTLSNLIPLPVGDLLAAPDLLEFGTSIPQTQALLVVLAATVVAAARLPAAIRLAAAVFALLPPAYVGHAASAGDHDIAVSALMSHLVPVSVWVGGLAAVLIHFRRSDDLAVVLPRFSTLALCCFAAVAVSGAASAWVRLSAPSDLWRSDYGLLLLAKVAVLAILGLFGWNHRRRTVAGVADRTVRRTFVRLAAGEVTVMVAAIGLAVGLSRTPPPPGSGGGHGQLALEYALAPFTPGALLTEFRLDPTVLLLLALPAAAYVVGARRAGPWPAGRALAWHAGLALAAWALLGGVGSYSRAMLSAQALQHIVLTVVAPLLLSLGAPLTLAARAFRHEHAGPGLLTRPVVLTAVYPVSFLLLYATPWLPWSLSGYAPHLLTELLFFGIGLLVFRVVAAVDPLPGPVPWADRARLLAAVTAVHLALGAFLLLGPAVAADWLSLVAPPGAPGILADQRLAGAVSMLLPLPALALLAVRMAPVLARDGR
ncbi:cytochrome c oxidase assembly protein [Nonomuraea sp. NPDC049695]|uniref:cytochrome c oxidase assembly protein n=1 Tax=Nonomuraea sp. NPDC049695 TaxID=3154734 RepID=UPI0034212E96